ncbi:MAG: phosphoadenylyl-sulfate reductase [Phycisphaerae bacterium]
MNMLKGKGLSAVSEETPTPELIAWSMDRFADQRMAMSTSFGMEGCALIDMYAQVGRPLTVVYLDTMFFFQETYELRDRMVERYPHVEFVNRGTTLTPEQQEAQYGPELWKRDSDLCCRLRKVDPMFVVMADVDVWITGLRRSQSASRANLKMIEWDWRYQVLKISPLVKWERPEIWRYIQDHNVPFNALHEQGYPTVGCTHCTKSVPGSTPGDYTRAGRWTDSEKTECGLHGGEGI